MPLIAHAQIFGNTHVDRGYLETPYQLQDQNGALSIKWTLKQQKRKPD